MVFNIENLFKRPKKEQLNQDESTDFTTHELNSEQIQKLEKGNNNEGNNLENPESSN